MAFYSFDLFTIFSLSLSPSLICNYSFRRSVSRRHKIPYIKCNNSIATSKQTNKTRRGKKKKLNALAIAHNIHTQYIKYKLVIARIQLNRLNKLEPFWLYINCVRLAVLLSFCVCLLECGCCCSCCFVKGMASAWSFWRLIKSNQYQSAHAHCAYIYDVYAISLPAYGACVSKLLPTSK